MIIARPPLRSIRRADVPGLVGLGVATGLMSIAFLAAIDRIPLGTAVAVEFLGPLTVAAVRSYSRRALAYPALALAGVALLTGINIAVTTVEAVLGVVFTVGVAAKGALGSGSNL